MKRPPITDEMKRIILGKIPFGPGEHITQSEITKSTGISGNIVRLAINDMRSKFVPICSDGNGYYIATAAADVDKTIRIFNSRIHNMIRAREGLKKAQKMLEEKI